ncbi:TolC family outer membrane protein [Aestuariispira insulae]|uniref:Outer membrane protein n=1 Tax=Aestuariispira insulae TaxID=1461337 RepID=A0A3D9HNF9_9PROT|nr:TolC family outer membrane protein [Aestuariispira insulae]RED51022.1 outer membrane protein [Aestuariispira insulae]
MRKVTVAAFGVFLMGGGVSALSLPSQAQTLQEALAAAYLNNPTLQAGRASLRATDESLPQAKDGWRPSISLTGTQGRSNQKIHSTGSSSDNDRTFWSAELSVTQNLYEGGGTEADIEAAEANILSARASLHSTEQSILLQAATAYLDVVRDQAVLELNIQNEARLEKQLEATRDRFEVGEVTRTDVAQAESRVSRARADRIDAKGNLETSKAVYEQIIGEQPNSISAPVIQLELPVNRDDAIALAQQKNPSVVAAEFDHKASVSTIRGEYADLLPSLDLSGSLSRSRNTSLDDRTTDDATVTATLTVPLYQQGAAHSEVREAKQSAAQAAREIDEARRSSIESAASGWETFQSSLAQIAAFEDEVRATTIALEGVEQEAAVGSRTVLDVLDAEQELLDARVSLVQSKRDELVARFELLSAVGGLTARDLDLPVSLYDEKKYYNDVKDQLWGIGEETEGEGPLSPVFR